MSEQLFELMRFQVMSASLQEGSRQRLDDAYVYAWSKGIYPVQHEAASAHKPFKELFQYSEMQVDQVADFLDDHSIKNMPLTFYQLEDSFGGKDSRIMLLLICRYLFLSKLFGDEFWSDLIKNGQCPAEAHGLTRPFNRDTDLFFH